MIRSTKWVLFYFIVLFLAAGCTKLSPELGFGKLSSSEDSLTLGSTSLVINSKNFASKITLAGKCELNTKILLSVKESFLLICENYRFSKELTAADFDDGETFVRIDALDDADNKIASRAIRIIKDTLVPAATISGPASISIGVNSILLYGSCSENDREVKIFETLTGNTISANCLNNLWDYSYDITAYPLASEFNFYAAHADSAFNEFTTTSLVVDRFILGTFSIEGVAIAGTPGYGNLVKNTSGSISISWSVSAGASTYDLKLERIEGAALPPALLCSFPGIASTAKVINLANECSMTPGQEIKITVTAWDSSLVNSISANYTFNTKAPAKLKADSRTLYINSSFTGDVEPTNIAFSSIIEDPNSTGPFTVSLAGPSGLDSQLVIDNSMGQKLTVSPTRGLAATSGVFNFNISITDENGITSGSLPLRVIIVFPFSWAGFVDNNFNDKSNWCGVADLKLGCRGQTANVDASSRIIIDDLCMFPSASPTALNCSPTLSENTGVKTFYMRSKNFFQNAHSLTVGSATDSEATFQMTGGNFNDQTSSGDVTFYRTFFVGGGRFTAPMGSNVFINTKMSPNGSKSFEVKNKAFYDHNQSNLNLVDDAGAGETMSQLIVTPMDFELKSLTINSNGGHWKIVSDNLILTGDLNLIGTQDIFGNRPRLNAFNTDSKILLQGNLNCEGAFQGGTLPIHIESAVTYKSIYAGCKFPPIVLSHANALATEDQSSTETIVMQGLQVKSGNFVAPQKIVFRTYGLESNSEVVNTASGFDHNNGEIVFENSENSKNYKIKLGSTNHLTFTNPNSFTAFYDIQNDLTANILSFEAAPAVPLRGSSRALTANKIDFGAPLVNDPFRISKIIAKIGGNAEIRVTTPSKVNLPNLEIQQSTFLTGSPIFDFSGTTLILGNSNLSVPGGSNLLYFNKTGTGSIIGGGTSQGGY
jgi:hypothetical protein